MRSYRKGCGLARSEHGVLAILLGVTDGFTHIRCGCDLGAADFKDGVAALEPLLGGKPVASNRQSARLSPTLAEKIGGIEIAENALVETETVPLNPYDQVNKLSHAGFAA